jgi:hypothetical protein
LSGEHGESSGFPWESYGFPRALLRNAGSQDRRWRSAALALALAVFAIVAPAAQAGWGRPFEFAAPGSLDYLPPQLAFSQAGAAAAAFGVEDVDSPGVSQAYLTSRSLRGAVGRPRTISGAQQILALAFDGGALQLLTGTSPRGQTCCSSAQASQLSAGGRLGRPRTLVGGLTGTTLGRLLTLGDGQMLAAVATERGVWVVQSARANRFGAQHRLTNVTQSPVSMSAAWLGGTSTIVAWTAATGTAGASDPRSIYVATGSGQSAPRRVRTAVTVASGHRIDELAVARRGASATLAWIESWYDSSGTYHAQVKAADLAAQPLIRAISPGNRLASGLSFAADAAGDQGLAWESCTTQASCTVGAAARGVHSTFGTSATLGATDAAQTPAVAVGTSGRVLIGWVRGGQPVAAAGSAGSRRFGVPVVLSASTFAFDVTIGFGPGRDALAAWTQGTLNPSVVGAAFHAP